MGRRETMLLTERMILRIEQSATLHFAHGVSMAASLWKDFEEVSDEEYADEVVAVYVTKQKELAALEKESNAAAYQHEVEM
jgi:hypothetical protein